MPERALTREHIIPEAALTYNTRLDIDALSQASQRTEENHPQAKNVLDNLKSLIKTNIATSLAERFNAEVYTTEYFFDSGRLRNAAYAEPFAEVVKRGQQFREEKGSQDIEREKAEVEGHVLIEQLLKDSETVVHISPPSGIYRHKFFDVYQKSANGRFTMSRFSSKCTLAQFTNRAEILDPFTALPQKPTAADFLRTPLITYRTLDEIKQILNLDNETMPLTKLQKIVRQCEPLIQYYIESPSDENYAAIVNFAESLKTSPELKSRITNPKEAAMHYGKIPVPIVATGCGFSGGSLFKPFSVVEFATVSSPVEDHNDFPCPRCRTIITYGAGIKECPGCGLPATCA